MNEETTTNVEEEVEATEEVDGEEDETAGGAENVCTACEG